MRSSLAGRLVRSRLDADSISTSWTVATVHLRDVQLDMFHKHRGQAKQDQILGAAICTYHSNIKTELCHYELDS